MISQNAKWGHAGFYIDRHRMTSLLTCTWLISILWLVLGLQSKIKICVPENILLQKSTAYVIDVESLELHRLYADLIMCYKIVFGLVHLTFSDFFAFSPSTATRGHQYKIYVNHSRRVRKYFFAERVVGPCNSLPTDTDFGTLKRFKLSIKSVDFKKSLHTES